MKVIFHSQGWPELRDLALNLAVIPHHETFSTTIQSPYRSTKG
jgi:hypothetical protein